MNDKLKEQIKKEELEYDAWLEAEQEAAEAEMMNTDITETNNEFVRSSFL